MNMWAKLSFWLWGGKKTISHTLHTYILAADTTNIKQTCNQQAALQHNWILFQTEEADNDKIKTNLCKKKLKWYFF